jgi:hypothetical protein
VTVRLHFPHVVWQERVFGTIWAAGVIAAAVVALVVGPPATRHRSATPVDRDVVRHVLVPRDTTDRANS